ncbi:MAG: PEP/pyruvate-binding domain-containing protein [Myxococcales bacterium]|nr:PEP/pyruvate-binding domain-containing protein [Myxococcales bacterium]
MSALLWLDRAGCDDPRRVGGKAASLARLAAEFPVPPGFCLPVDARGDADSISSALREAVARAYETLGARSGSDAPAVAVRSSAVDEDGALASFAGIFSSYLNVRGLEDVLSAITRCWASARDPRVRAYRARRGGDVDAGIGVLVQALVPADAAAVVFSVNPASGARDELVINANWGLGESVVSGLVTPDTWILRRPGLAQLQFRVGDKLQMTVRDDKGTREVPVLRTLRRRPCLTDGQARALGELALRLEERAGHPVDVECAYADERLYLLQCRPITTRVASS